MELIIGIAVFTVLAIILVGRSYLIYRVAIPGFMGQTSEQETKERIASVRASGPEMASVRCSGQFAGMYYGEGLLRVTVCPAGIVVQPSMMGVSMAVLRSEIRRLEIMTGSFLMPGEHICVEYESRHVLSPLVMHASPYSDVAEAIERISKMRFTRLTKARTTSPTSR